jgi:pimeloyl-ACP methyl ester carboxylesterase
MAVEKEIEILGRKAYYAVAGRGRPVVIIPGWSLTHKSYLDIVDIFGLNYKAYCLSMPGFGKGAALKEVWDLDRFASFVLAFMKKLRIHSPILIGHSFGGAVCSSIAASNRIKVRALVLVDSVGVPVKHTRKEWAVVLLKYARERLKENRHNELKPQVINDYATYIQNNIRNPYAYKMVGSFAECDFSSHLIKIKAPTLILWADRDIIISPKNGKRMHRLIAGSRLEIVEGNHGWLIARPLLFADKVYSFLSKRLLG